jgi:Xaa-Pro aminopeptidase
MADGSMTLLTRSADLRQARHTSIIDNIVLWTDRDNANPTLDLRNLLNDLDLLGARIGVEYDTHGLTAFNGRRLDEQLQTFGQIVDASGIVGRLRLFKSPAEIEKAEKAASARRRCARRGPAADQAGRRRRPGSWPPCRARSSPVAATIPPTSSSSAPAPTRCSAATRPAAASSTRTTS